MMRIVDCLGKGKQQPRHQEEYRYHTENNGFRQDNTHIVTNPELHEHHGYHTGDRGQGAGRNLRDCLTQSYYYSLSGILVLMLLHKTVCQNDGIIYCQT